MASFRSVGTVLFALLLPALALAEDFSQQGQQALKKKDYERAIACFTKAIEANPKDTASYRGRGDAYLHKEQSEKALADLNEAIRLDSKDGLAYFKRGATYLFKGQRDQAIKDFTTAIHLHPTADAYNNRGGAFIQNGEVDKALDDLTEAVRLDPRNQYAHDNRAQLYELWGEYEKAAADREAAQRSSTPTSGRIARIAPVPASELSAKIVADCTEAIRRNPHDAKVYLRRGRFYAAKRNFAEAIKDFTTSIHLDPSDSAGYLCLARVLSGNGEHDWALAVLLPRREIRSK